MKLELKYLASYLPYGLNIKDVKHGSVFEALHFITNQHQDFSLFKGNFDQLINDKYLKPILFPLSSLTKEITVNGETFVPYDKIKEIYPNTPQFTDYIKGWMQYYGIMNSKCEYVCILKLFEWKIDVLQLIDKNLAEPVTEDFNPYK